MDRSLLVAVILGVLQGALEWLPVSSEGFVSVALTALGRSPESAVRFSLVLHAGTAVAAAVYYREDIAATLGVFLDGAETTDGGGHRHGHRNGAARADLSFLVVATLVSGVVGIGGYLLVEDLVSALTGGSFLAVVGFLLVGTGVLQRVAGVDVARGEADDRETAPDGGGVTTTGRRRLPDGVDAVLVGVLQGVAVLPGISRSGTTVSALLLRGHDGPASLRLSFLLSIPAALGAGGIAVVDGGGLSVSPLPAAVALVAAAVVGYLTVDALTRLVRRLAFWAVCVGLGSLGVLGGVLAATLS